MKTISWCVGVAALGLVALGALVAPALADRYADARRAMMRAIENDVRYTSRRLGKSTLDARVLRAMTEVPRHEFVPAAERAHAYENRPLPIGYGQTISQPYIVAIMTDLLDVGRGDRVLEVGTGSGYQAAILAQLGAEVSTIEIIQPLGESARERLQRLGYDTVKVRVGDGYYGWKERAPFEAIIVTAAASHIPPPLLEQLKPGGRMIIPVGNPFAVQHLVLVDKQPDGRVTTQKLLAVAFVPLTGGPR